MRQPLPLISLSLAVLLSAGVLAQNPVPIQFQTDPVQARTGTDVTFSVVTVPDILSMTWSYKGETLGLWVGGSATVNPVPQFVGRLAISAVELRITTVKLQDAGNYSVEVTPLATTGLATNSRSVQLRVFDAVVGVSIVVPTAALEGNNVTLRCTWTSGTDVTVEWGKGGVAVASDGRITVSGDSLVINPARRSDAGEYTCTARNPINAQTATQTLTVFYGPDTPVLTKEAQKECVGGGDVLVGQTARLTCTSVSLPPALFSWQRDGQPVASGQPGSGELSLQTFSTNESGRYVCTARNSITGGTSEQGTDLAVVDTCLNVGEVVGIVIGCVALIVIIVLLILLIVCLVRRRRAEQRHTDTWPLHKTEPNTRPIPPDPQPNGARDLGQGPHPPLYHSNTHVRHPDRTYTARRENTSVQNGRPNSVSEQHNGRAHTNGAPHDPIHNTNSYPHNGIDNPAFTHVDAQNTLRNTQQNPNILIQASPAQGRAQPAALHLSLNTAPDQHNNNAHMPTIHVNLNPYPADVQPPQQDSSFPVPSAANHNNNASQTQQHLMHAGQSDPRMQSMQPQPNGGHPGLIPTGHTFYNSNNTLQRNAKTQTYEQEPESRSRSDRSAGRREDSSGHRQRPWDRLRGTPAYPPGTPQRAPERSSDSTDYSSPSERTSARPQHQSSAAPRGRSPTTRRAPSADRQTRSRSADLRVDEIRELQRERMRRSPRSQREESAERDIRGSPSSRAAPRQEAAHRNHPEARPLRSQPPPAGRSAPPAGLSAPPAGRSALPRGPAIQQEVPVLQGADTRALADPNHLPQAQVARQPRAEPVQKATPPQAAAPAPAPAPAQPATHAARGAAPASSAPHQSSTLTRAALRAHTEQAHTFRDRRQQTQAALLHPGTEARAPTAAARAGAQHPPTPPPVIPLAQFQSLPKKQTHKSPARGPQAPRPPVNIPAAQRHLHTHPRQHHPATAPAGRHPPPGHAHRHAPPHGHVRGHPAHATHPRQQQAHRGRPR